MCPDHFFTKLILMSRAVHNDITLNVLSFEDWEIITLFWLFWYSTLISVWLVCFLWQWFVNVLIPLLFFFFFFFFLSRKYILKEKHEYTMTLLKLLHLNHYLTDKNFTSLDLIWSRSLVSNVTFPKNTLTLVLLNPDMPSLCKQCKSRSAGFFNVTFPKDTLTLVLLNPDMPSLCKQCKSRSVGFWRSQLIWICIVCH